MNTNIPSSKSAHSQIKFYVGRSAISELVLYLDNINAKNLVLVCDKNQYKALGKEVEEKLDNEGFRSKLVVLKGEEIGADEDSITQVLLATDDSDQIFIAIGSGTITDLVRFISYRAKSHFISLPTAPSVDGFASNGSSMTIQKLKQTVVSRPPLAIFADLDTLVKAPDSLIAAGFGDMYGKYTALADWKIANLVNGDVYDHSIAERSRAARDIVVKKSYLIKENREQSITSVMEALYEEGLCMLDFGASRPASGAEHSFSHYWETILLLEDRPSVLHGAKVGLASIWIAKYFEMVRQMPVEEVKDRLKNNPQFDTETEITKIYRGYGDYVGRYIEKIQQPYLQISNERYKLLQSNLINHWPEIQEIAQEVPSSDEMIVLLKNVGGAITPEDLGLTQSDIKNAMEYAQYMRKSFSILNIFQMLDCRPAI